MRRRDWIKQEREEEGGVTVLVSTYNKSAVKVKAELESEEMKIKRRKEAAEWMKKKYLDEKMYKQKARKVKESGEEEQRVGDGFKQW